MKVNLKLNMGPHVSVGSQIVAISFIRLPTLIIPYTLFDLIMMQMCSRENLSLLLNHISKNSLPKNSLWTFMKALCELCGQIFVLMEFAQSLPFLLRDGGRMKKYCSRITEPAKERLVNSIPIPLLEKSNSTAWHALPQMKIELLCCVCSLFL